VLLLPAGPLLQDSPGWNHDFLVDLVHYRRPTVNGLMPPEAAMAPTAYRALWQGPALSALRACESDPSSLPGPGAAASLDALVRAGVASAWVTQAQIGGGRRRNDYLRCLVRVLGNDIRTDGPLLRFDLELGRTPSGDLPRNLLVNELGAGGPGR
jgi:hypothetical protein